MNQWHCLYSQPGNYVSCILYKFIKVSNFSSFLKFITEVQFQMPQFIRNSHILSELKNAGAHNVHRRTNWTKCDIIVSIPKVKLTACTKILIWKHVFMQSIQRFRSSSLAKSKNLLISCSFLKEIRIFSANYPAWMSVAKYNELQKLLNDTLVIQFI